MADLETLDVISATLADASVRMADTCLAVLHRLDGLETAIRGLTARLDAITAGRPLPSHNGGPALGVDDG